MLKRIAFTILMIAPFWAISQNFDITVTNSNPCQGDTIRVSHPNGLVSLWTADESAFTPIGNLSGTSTLLLVCNEAGTYTITADDGTDNGSVTISVYGVDSNFELVKGKLNTLKINVRSMNQPEPYALPYYFTWNFGDGNILKDSVTSTNDEDVYFAARPYIYSDSGIFDISLKVRNARGCESTTTKTDTISGSFLAPNVFTPNGDGVNDFFTARTNGSISFSMVVYSRWGNVVFESEQPSTSVVWDGRLKGGRKVSTGVYYYVVTPEDETANEKLTGFVHVFVEKE